MPEAATSTAQIAESTRQRWGFRVMAGVLILAAGLKTMSLVFPTRWLGQPNAIFPFTERWVLVLAIAADTCVALALLSRKFNYATKLVFGGWLLGISALYRGGLYWLGDPKHCGCVGDPSAWWPWLKNYSNTVSWLLAVVLVASYSRALLTRNSRPGNQMIFIK